MLSFLRRGGGEGSDPDLNGMGRHAAALDELNRWVHIYAGCLQADHHLRAPFPLCLGTHVLNVLLRHAMLLMQGGKIKQRFDGRGVFSDGYVPPPNDEDDTQLNACDQLRHGDR